MTIPEILKTVADSLGSYSQASFSRDCRRLKIKPLGSIRTIPRRYPPETALAILKDRGVTIITPEQPRSKRLVSLAVLKRTSKRAKKARAAR